MARCAGCAGSGCSCVVDGITITGTGVLGDPFVAVGGGGSGGPPLEGTYYVASSSARPEIKAQADFVCDGVADDVQVQAAIDAAIAHTFGEVVLSEGPFTFAATVTVPTGLKTVSLRGTGAGGGDYDGPVPATSIVRPLGMLIPVLSIEAEMAITNIFFQDTVNLTDKASMIDTATFRTVTVEHCFFQTFPSTFPNARARAISGTGQFKIQNCSFTQITGACIAVSDIYQVRINNNYFYTTSGSGGAFGSSEYCIILEGSAPAGDDDDWPFIISGNFSDGNQRGTVQLIGVANGLLSDNVFLFDREATILVDQCAEVQINSNQFGGTDLEVIQVSNSLYIQVNDNQIHLPGTHGVLLTGSNDCQVNNNHILTGTAAGSAGVMIDADSNTNMVTGNMVRGTFTYGIRVNNANCNDNWVTNNDLKNSGTTPFSDIGTGTAITAGNRLV